MTLTPVQRLIVAADFTPPQGGEHDAYMAVHQQVLRLATALTGTGITIKLNSALRAVGYSLLRELKEYDVPVFADLKLNDIPNTLEADGALLSDCAPAMLTVMCSTGRESIAALKKYLPHTEVLGVTALSSFDDDDTMEVYGEEVGHATTTLADVGKKGGVDGFICASTEIALLRKRFGGSFTVNATNIRSFWSRPEGDDQNPERAMTPENAIAAGATRIVVGRPITQSSNPLEAIKRIVAEIEQGLSQRDVAA